MTCTPIGINTERLLVSATRADIPEVVPHVADAPVGSAIPQIVKDVAPWVALVLALLVVLAVRRRRRRRRLSLADGAAH
jgi:sortase A